MKIRKSLAITFAATLCLVLSAAGQSPEAATTANTLPQQTLSVQNPQPESSQRAEASPQTIEQVAIHKLNSIAQDLSETKENTDPRLTSDLWKTIAGFSLIITVLSLFVAIGGLCLSYLNYDEQKLTQHNTSRLPLKEQQGILIDMIRHLYRNLVVSRTIETKMRALDFQAYPSEEHLIKLQIPLERIKLDSFLSTNFTQLSELYLKFRNYNEEILIIKDHFKDPNLRREVKERDLETLTFKCGFLASKIHPFLVGAPEKEQEKGAAQRNDAIVAEIFQKIKDSQNENIKKYSGNAIAPEIEKAITPYKNERDSFMEILDSEEQKTAFWEGLNRDIRIECGNKQRAEEMTRPGFKYEYTTDKIYMIRFDNREKPSDSQKDKTEAKKNRRTVKKNKTEAKTDNRSGE